ncbi:hypothetical protein N7474_004911 [Penicillium riverlandense]|uniref:uncharacterized protein n=1 Tax=Penicillium riverlandense TaxID=1903569 RepID=UPI0025482562|nr:uncharacterized protein N7474_004911 [Penicillium riverlandense]KAJ5819320.1 hypothetical protein N7474_004911 [Penicillium riverlandense]
MSDPDTHRTQKRRRLDAASTLSKPFKSPLRRRTTASSENVPSTTEPTTPEATKHKNESLLNPAPTPGNSSPILKSSLPASGSPIRKRKPAIMTLSTPTTSPLTDPKVLELQKKQRTLRTRIGSLRSEIDTARQALRIESSSKGADLEALIFKWRFISQEAADEVFLGARDRVARMGGLGVWQERSKRDNAPWDDSEQQKNEDGGEGDSYSGDMEYDGDMDVDSPQKGVSEKQDSVQDDEEFTMAFMLKMLHVEAATIGFDVSGQKWIR